MPEVKYNVVIVDDETEILNMIGRFLNRSDKYHVATYSNPLTALEEIDENVDLVLLDIMMPQMNGLDVLEKLTSKFPRLKVVMMTAYSTLDKVLKSHKIGAVHYLMKPFDSLQILQEKIDEVLEM
jgi:DNA-binding NtrC family response regulator